MGQKNSVAMAEPRQGLSARQTEVILLVGKGLTSKEIAREIGISPSTVDNHVKAAVDRIGARNRFDAFQRVHLSKEDSNGEPMHLDFAELPKDKPFSLLRLPPLGGRPNHLSPTIRLFHVVQIAVILSIGFSAAILTIAGVVHVLIK
ncbi:MAG: helix-turn-helix transcriptional regulator [Alteripontixanthobacter sp.]